MRSDDDLGGVMDETLPGGYSKQQRGMRLPLPPTGIRRSVGRLSLHRRRGQPPVKDSLPPLHDPLRWEMADGQLTRDSLKS
jgi:hypothetical protein